MNVQITRNNLQIIINELESKDKHTEKSKAFLQFIKDGDKCISILNAMIANLNDTIAINFKSDLIKKIDENKSFIQVSRLEEELRKANEEITQLREVNNNLMNGI